MFARTRVGARGVVKIHWDALDLPRSYELVHPKNRSPQPEQKKTTPHTTQNTDNEKRNLETKAKKNETRCPQYPYHPCRESLDSALGDWP